MRRAFDLPPPQPLVVNRVPSVVRPIPRVAASGFTNAIPADLARRVQAAHDRLNQRPVPVPVPPPPVLVQQPDRPLDAVSDAAVDT
jgi:hypothetical protein